MNQIENLSTAVGRVIIAMLFIMAGVSKITGYDGTAQFMDGAGVSSALLPLVIIVELGGGIALAIGWLTRWWAWALAGFCIVSGVLFHYEPGNQMQMTMLMKNVALAGGLMFIAGRGAGAFSLEGKGASAD
jgi:putative oxidoreductase